LGKGAGLAQQFIQVGAAAGVGGGGVRAFFQLLRMQAGNGQQQGKAGFLPTFAFKTP
jgi:hypothetical protein